MTTMEEIYDYVKLLEDTDASHKTKKYKLKEVSEQFILGRAQEELAELVMSAIMEDEKRAKDKRENFCLTFAIIDWKYMKAEMLKEVADVFGCLIHYCVRRGWSMHEVAEALHQKLIERFPQGADAKSV